jgi:hypothetical protein
MTSVANLVADLQARGITLEARGTRLAVRPASRVTDDEKAALRRHRAEVLAVLRTDPAEVSPPPAWCWHHGPVNVPPGHRLIARPVSRLTPNEQEALRQHKAEIMTLLERSPVPPDPLEVARILGLQISQLDRMVEIRVPWLPVTLWFVPGPAEVEILVAEGVTPGRIWTSLELLQALAIPDITTAGVRRLAEAKLEFKAEITGIRAIAP